MPPKPFSIHVEQSVLDDLKTRLQRTRWPDQENSAEWSMGTNLEYLKKLVDYWQGQYDWRKHEAELNKLPQFTANVDGTTLHFVHVKSNKPNALPLLLLHGWPDGFYRYQKVIPMLSDADMPFDVIVPSLPGHGFSDRKPAASAVVADLYAKLMVEILGYKKFFAAGGDHGSIVARALTRQHADKVIAIHLTDVGYPRGNEDFSTMTKDEQEFARFVQQWWMVNGAYAMVHATKPQTIAPALNDSPVGLASWIISMIDIGSASHDVESAFGGRDMLLTNITIYWVTQTAGSAARMYLHEARASYGPNGPIPETKSKTPVGVTLFPREAQFPKEWAERTLNVQRYVKMPRGGHFAPLEEPVLYTKTLQEFFVRYRWTINKLEPALTTEL